LASATTAGASAASSEAGTSRRITRNSCRVSHEFDHYGFDQFAFDQWYLMSGQTRTGQSCTGQTACACVRGERLPHNGLRKGNITKAETRLSRTQQGFSSYTRKHSAIYDSGSVPG
jgi:hypothetical protein